MTRKFLSFIRGMGSAIDILPVRETHRVGQGIDMSKSVAEILAEDWAAVAADFRQAFDEVSEEAGLKKSEKHGQKEQ